MQTTGQRASGFHIRSLDSELSFSLPNLIEYDEIPDDRANIHTPEADLHHSHLKRIAHLIPTLQPKTPIRFLLGRDILRVHNVRKQINGLHDAPYAQKLDLGWVLVDNVCLEKVHKPPTISTYHTFITKGGRPTLFDSCPNTLQFKEFHHKDDCRNKFSYYKQGHLGRYVFQRNRDDEKVAPSIEDIAFLKIIG